MYFETLKIHGFGCLRTSVNFAENKLNLVIADNEAGKSTLVDVLLAAFYGVETDNRKTNTRRPHYKHVLPWSDPNEFGFILDFATEDVLWRIERNFIDNSVRVIDRSNEKDLSNRYHRGSGKYHIGEDLIGLSCEDFLKSFYLRQEDSNYITKAGGLTSHVQKVASVSNEGITSESAIERLGQSLLKYPLSPTPSGLNVNNTIKRFTIERDRLDNEIESLDRRRSEIEPDCHRLAEIENDLKYVNVEKEKYLRLADRNELEELSSQLEYQAKLQETIEELNKTLSNLEEYAEFPADKWEQLISHTTSYNDILNSTARLDADIQNRVIEPLEELKKESVGYEDLQQITEQDLHEFEDAVSRLEDRRSRFISIRKERDQLSKQLKKDGFDKNEHEKRTKIFEQLDSDESQFVEDYNRKTEEVEQIYRTDRAARGAFEERRDRSLTVNKRKSDTAKIILISAAAIAITAGITLILSPNAWYGFALGGLCIITSVIGFMFRSSAITPRSKEVNTADMELAIAVNKERESQKKLEIMKKELEQITITLDFTESEKLLSEYAEFKHTEQLIKPLQNIESDLDDALQYALEAIKMVGPFFEKAGSEPPQNADAVKTTQDLLERCRISVDLNKKQQALSILKEQMNGDMNKLQSEKDTSHKEITSILKLAGIKSDLTPEESVNIFREALDKYKEYQSISVDQLPRLKREIIPEDSLSIKEERFKHLQNVLSGFDFEMDSPYERTELYREKIESASTKIDNLNEERIEISRGISVIYDQYQATYPVLIRERAELIEKLQRAESFRDEIEISIRIMKDIAEQVYGYWATALSEETAPLLEALNPSYTNIKFNDELTFTITDNRQNKEISSKDLEVVLSSGARDEVFLAARLGIARYLSRNSKDTLPIVLDEPLAMADDERFLNGMKFFLDPLSDDHQVLIMSCHEQRHHWLNEQLPELFKEKVHIVNIGSA